MQRCISSHPFIDCFKVPFLGIKSLNGSHHHSIAFVDATSPFVLSKDLKGAVPCTGFQPLAVFHWQLRFDAPSTELNTVFRLAALGLDAETTAFLRHGTWASPCSSALQKCTDLCQESGGNSKYRVFFLSYNAHLKSHSSVRLLIHTQWDTMVYLQPRIHYS